MVVLIIFASLYFATKRDTNDDDDDDDDDAHSLRGRIANSEKNSRKRVVTGSYGTKHGTHKGGNNSSVAELR